MADIASQYPTSPSFNKVTISTNTPTLATETFSGKTRRVGQGHTFYNWQIKYPTLTDREAGLVEGFLAQTYGSLFSFEIVLPEVSYSKSTNPPSTTPATTTSYAAGAKSVALDNCGATKKFFTQVIFLSLTIIQKYIRQWQLAQVMAVVLLHYISQVVW